MSSILAGSANISVGGLVDRLLQYKGVTMEINIEKFRHRNWYVKYFSCEKYAEEFYNFGRMQFCPLKYFIGLENKGRGDSEEGKITGAGILYYKEPNQIKYSKLTVYQSLRGNTQSLVYCISNLPKYTYAGDTFLIDPKIYDDFGENVNEVFAVFIDKEYFHKRLFSFCTERSIKLAYDKVLYDDNEIAPSEVIKILGNQSHRHYFKKPTKYRHQCEFRYVVGNDTQDFIEKTQAQKTKNGYTIDIGCLHEFSFLAKIVR